MKFSLILCTVNRVAELERFMSYLAQQTHRDFEVILIDQNQDDRLKTIVDCYRDVNHIRYFKVDFKGLSRARNEGLKHMTGDAVAFPDDDCWYEDPSLLERVQQLLIQNPQIDGVGGRSGAQPSICWPIKDCPISKANVFSTFISITLFLRSSVVDAVGLFEEGLGVGSGTIYGSCEEIEYILRALLKGFHLFYFAGIFVEHPKADICSKIDTKKAYSYSIGFAYILKKYRFSFYYKCRCLLRPILATGLFLLLKPPRAKYHWAIFKGRLKGFLSHPLNF